MGELSKIAKLLAWEGTYGQSLDKRLSDVLRGRDNLTDRVNKLESRNKALLQELVECATELQCSCGHPACKQCQRYKQLLEFIGSCPERNSEGFKTEEFTKEIIEALLDAKSIAMKNVFAARIPECGDFGGIAQNLQYVCEQLGITDS